MQMRLPDARAVTMSGSSRKVMNFSEGKFSLPEMLSHLLCGANFFTCGQTRILKPLFAHELSRRNSHVCAYSLDYAKLARGSEKRDKSEMSCSSLRLE
ncbi:hypothetical protein ACTXT7_008610 [Hymenolepis weldensis]